MKKAFWEMKSAMKKGGFAKNTKKKAATETLTVIDESAPVPAPGKETLTVIDESAPVPAPGKETLTVIDESAPAPAPGKDEELLARFPSIIDMTGMSRSQRKNIPNPGGLTHNQKRKYRRPFKGGKYNHKKFDEDPVGDFDH